MLTADFDYFLPPELIAQEPVEKRDQSRLLVLDRTSGTTTHGTFASGLLAFLKKGDVLVLNNSRVIAARLRGRNNSTNGQFEILLLEENSKNDWWTMMRPGKRARAGTEIRILNAQKEPTSIVATVSEINSEGHRRLQFKGAENILTELASLGELPLPPYIERTQARSEDEQRYQTVYADRAGSVAAPTAGLHFTKQLLTDIESAGVTICQVTLHVGLGTFAPVKAETLSQHIMHEERFEIPEGAAQKINLAKAENRRVIAVGTTSVRVLETVAAMHDGQVVSGPAKSKIFIFPPYQFRIVDALITNFHLPCSTLLMLVSAFAAPATTDGREKILSAYAEAIRERYRFFSYGDAMLIH